MSEKALEVKNLGFHYPDKPEIKILEKVSFSLKQGEILAILGPNGCGKTTLLNIIAGFLQPVEGCVEFSERVKDFVSVVPQGIGLLDWKSALQNVELALLSKNLAKTEMKRIAEESLKLCGVLMHKEKIPKQLSGGLKQRTAIARALAPEPKLLLLDEPFSSLDSEIKNSLINDLKAIVKGRKISAVIVIHDLEEALLIADRLLFINRKKILEQELKFNKNSQAQLWKEKRKIEGKLDALSLKNHD